MRKGKHHKTPPKVSTLMGRHLRSLLEVLDQQQTLLEKIRQLLPRPLGDHLISAQMHQRKLVLHVDTPAWASRLRYQTPSLLKSLTGFPSGPNSIQVRIQPHPVQNQENRSHCISLSAEAARQLRNTAEGLHDPALSAALQRLAACHGKN